MASIFTKLKEILFADYDDGEGYDDDYDPDYDDYDNYEDDHSSYNNIREMTRQRDVEYENGATSRKLHAVNSNKQTASIHQLKSVPPSSMKMIVMRPRAYEEAQVICDEIKGGRAVVVNLEQVDFPLSQRIMDFLSGTAYSLEGHIERVTNAIFIVAPNNVEVTSAAKEEVRNGNMSSWSNGR